MADLAFHRKYRPKNLNEYLGDKVKSTIINRFSDENNYPQTILLYGTRGTGKTSMARLIAKEVLCLKKVDGHACGECEMCLEIEEKLIQTQAGVTCMSVNELDIASDSGKAAIEAALEDALLEPIATKYKILILDECHMATKQSQNALLKLVEEPPKHLCIIFCTTNEEQLLGTLKSRMQLKIEVRKPSVDELSNKLLDVCKQEGITTSIEALKIIAKKSDRIIRESLNVLESIAKENGNRATIVDVQRATGEVASEVYIEFYKAGNSSLDKIMLFNKMLKERDISPKDFIKGLTRFTLDCINIRYGISLEDYPVEYVKEVKKFFSIYNSEEMDFLLQIIEYANKMIGEDETRSELIITTTAMRIGKLKLLAVGLTNEDAQAIKENQSSFVNYKGILKDEMQSTQRVIHSNLNESMLVSVFGKNVAEVKGGINLDVKEDDDKKESTNDDKLLSDDELLGLFNAHGQ